jgi:hypothetical protein
MAYLQMAKILSFETQRTGGTEYGLGTATKWRNVL